MTFEPSEGSISPISRDTRSPSKDIPDAVAGEIESLRREIAELREALPEEKAAFVIFSGDLDRAIAAFIIATGAAVAGLETTMFFTFWGLSILKKKNARASKKDLMQRMFDMMTPGSSESLGVSKLNYFGMGAVMLRQMMKKQDASSLEDLMQMASDLGVKFIGCTMSMDVMGIKREELLDNIELGGVASFMGEAARSRVSQFI